MNKFAALALALALAGSAALCLSACVDVGYPAHPPHLPPPPVHGQGQPVYPGSGGYQGPNHGQGQPVHPGHGQGQPVYPGSGGYQGPGHP